MPVRIAYARLTGATAAIGRRNETVEERLAA
jgi:hypothetical protein